MSKTNKCINNCDSDMGSELDLDELMKEIENDDDDEDHNTENDKRKKENKSINKNEKNNKIDGMQKKENNTLKKSIKDNSENESENNRKRTYAVGKYNKEITKNEDLNDPANPKKQKTTVNDIIPKKEEHVKKIEEEKNNNHNNNVNRKDDDGDNIFQKKLLEEYIRLPLMKRIDQYLEEFKKENHSVPSYLDMETSSIINKIETLEEVFQNYNNDDNKNSEKNKTIRFALMARYSFYIWLKKNRLFQDNNNLNITEENKKQFIKWSII